jgi:AraC family transcriptional regulator
MGTTWHHVAAGPGWSVGDFICRAGPHDRPFEERHETTCIAIVTAGTFQYRATHGEAVLAPGALLLGNEGHCFKCGHEHAAGDRCLAFHFAPEYWESIVAGVPRARHSAFRIPRLPPLPRLMPIIAAAEAARDAGDGAALEELALRLAGAAVGLLTDQPPATRRVSPRDTRRITRALRQIEADSDAALSLAQLARVAAMSPYHFLRTFRRVVGMTPHQYVLRTRLHRAAVRLRRGDDPIGAVAFETGFNDLSTFNHRFRRLMGESPSTYRAHRNEPRRG